MTGFIAFGTGNRWRPRVCADKKKSEGKGERSIREREREIDRLFIARKIAGAFPLKSNASFLVLSTLAVLKRGGEQRRMTGVFINLSAVTSEEIVRRAIYENAKAATTLFIIKACDEAATCALNDSDIIILKSITNTRARTRTEMRPKKERETETEK